MSIFSKVGNFISNTYTSIDKSLGGILPGGSPAPTAVGGTTTSTSIPATNKGAVISTDTNQGSVTTYINSSGQVTARNVSYVEGSNPQDLVNAADRPGGLVEQTQTQLTPAQQDTGIFSPDFNAGANRGGVISGSTSTNAMGFQTISITSGGARTDYNLGVPVISQQEAAKYGINPATTPVWVLSNESSNGGMWNDKAFAEFAYASSLPYYSKAVETTDSRVANLATIRAGQEIFRQGYAGANLTEVEVNTIYSKSVVQARADYSTLPFSTRAGYYGAGLAQGVTSTAIKTAEFLQSGALTLFYGKEAQFTFGGTLGEAANYPVARSSGFLNSPGTFIKESFSSPSIVASLGIVAVGAVGYASRIREVGFFEASAEAGSFVSPIRFKNGIYGAVLTEETTFTNIRSFKATNSEGITNRIYGGSSESGTQIFGIESFNNKFGIGAVGTSGQVTEIRAGGAIIETGRLTTFQPYAFEQAGTGVGFRAKDFFSNGFSGTEALSPEFPGATSRVITSRGLTTYEFPSKTITYENFNSATIQTSGGVSSTKGSITQFASGKANPIYKTEYFGDLRANMDTGVISRDFTYSPSGRYKTNVRFSGYEINLNTFSQDKGYTSFRGGGTKTPFNFGESGQAQILQTSNNFNIPRIKAAKIVNTGGTTEIPLMVGGAGLSEGQVRFLTSTRGGGYSNGVQDYAITSSVIVLPSVTAYGISQRSENKSGFAIPAISNAALGLEFVSPGLSQIPRITQIPNQSFRLITGQKLITGFATGGGFNFNFNTPDIPSTFTGGFPFALGGLSDFSATNIVAGGKRRTGYTPSFSALVFNIRGAYSGGGSLSKSGIDFRPIIPGFKFNTGLGGGKVRFKIK